MISTFMPTNEQIDYEEEEKLPEIPNDDDISDHFSLRTPPSNRCSITSIVESPSAESPPAESPPAESPPASKQDDSPSIQLTNVSLSTSPSATSQFSFLGPKRLSSLKSFRSTKSISTTNAETSDKRSSETSERRKVSFKMESIPNFLKHHDSIDYDSDDDTTHHSDEPHPQQWCKIASVLSCTCLNFHTPSWTRISSFLVRNAPCFWCCKTLDIAATNRAILLRLNVLNGFFSLGQMASGIFLSIVLLPANSAAGVREFIPNLWNLNSNVIILAIIGFVEFCSVVLTRRVIQEVNLVGVVKYLWVLMWILPIEIFLVISLFDYHRVTHVWIRHWWDTPSFGWFREKFCPSSTAHTKCKAPIMGGPLYDTVEQWCLSNFNSTDCRGIQEDAQDGMRYFCYAFYTVNAIWGLLFVCVIFLTIRCLEELITLPIVQSSRESNIPIWLILPIVGCTVTGSILLFSPSSVTDAQNVYWIGVTYLVSGGTFFVAALLGWFISAYQVLNSRDNRNRQVAVLMFIGIIVFTIFSLGSIFVTSVIFSVNLVDVDLDEELRGAQACLLDENAGTCTGCNDATVPRCPEWGEEEIRKVMQTTLKQSATLAAIFLLYAFSALKFGFSMRSHLSMYQIDYV